MTMRMMQILIYRIIGAPCIAILKKIESYQPVHIDTCIVQCDQKCLLLIISASDVSSMSVFLEKNNLQFGPQKKIQV